MIRNFEVFDMMVTEIGEWVKDQFFNCFFVEYHLPMQIVSFCHSLNN